MVCCCPHEESLHFPRVANVRSTDPHDKAHQRQLTNVPCCLLFLLCMTAAGGLVGWSIFFGDSRRLTHGFDYGGNLCGVDKDSEGKLYGPYLYFCGSMDRVGGLPKKLDFRSRSCVEKCPTDDSEEISCLMKAYPNFTKLGEDTQTRKDAGGKEDQLTFGATLNVFITQSVTKQKSYPTEVFGERFCVANASVDGGALRETTISQMRGSVRVSAAVASFRHAWPMPVVAALIAMILSMVFLFILRKFAGPLLFSSLCVGALLMLIIGLFFLFGLFFDPWNLEGSYQQLNPLFYSYPGGDGKAASVITGLVLLAMGLGMGYSTYHSIDKIDESIGVIQAAVDCLFVAGDDGVFHALDFLFQPITQSLSVIALFIVLFWGGMLVASVGYINPNSITINDRAVEGLEKDFEYFWGWHAVIWFYGLCAVWLTLTLLALHQFSLSYAVCVWFFIEYEDTGDKKQQSAPKTITMNADLDHVGRRQGVIEGDVLKIPLGRAGPDGKYTGHPQQTRVKRMDCGAVEKGFSEGLFFHLGSLALGALISSVTAPLRAIALLLKAITTNPNGEGADAGIDNSPNNPVSLATSTMLLVGNLLDHLVGGFGKGAYVDIVLSSSSYLKAANDAVDFIAEVGGVVAVLHGTTALYEMIGVTVITAVSGGLSFVLIDLPFFKDPQSSWYVPNPWEITVLCTIVSGIVASSFMSLFNIAADTLLYAFAWSRVQQTPDPEKFVPLSIQELFKEEMHAAPSSMLKPSTGNKFRQISAVTGTHLNDGMNTLKSMWSNRGSAAGRAGPEAMSLLA